MRLASSTPVEVDPPAIITDLLMPTGLEGKVQDGDRVTEFSIALLRE
jgi:hypothetical protein